MKNILAAVDFSNASSAVLDQASGLAMAFNAKLWILHVASDEIAAMAYESAQFTDYAPEFVNFPGDVQLARDLCAEEFKREHAQLLGMSAKLRKEGVVAQALLLTGNPADTIVEKAKEIPADVIVIGSQGHGLLRKALLGSVSEAVIRHARCNILIVPAAK
jgi:nucleotide-binding universal stress UspA family protein